MHLIVFITRMAGESFVVAATGTTEATGVALGAGSATTTFS